MAKEICPISPTPKDAGGQIDVRVGEKDNQQHLRFTYTPVGGIIPLDAKARCAFIELSQKAVKNPNMDSTRHACDATEQFDYNLQNSKTDYKRFRSTNHINSTNANCRLIRHGWRMRR